MRFGQTHRNRVRSIVLPPATANRQCYRGECRGVRRPPSSTAHSPSASAGADTQKVVPSTCPATTPSSTQSELVPMLALAREPRARRKPSNFSVATGPHDVCRQLPFQVRFHG